MDTAIPLARLPHSMTVDKNSAYSSLYDWWGPIFTPGTVSYPCLVSWKSTIFEGLSIGEFSDIVAIIFCRPDVDVEVGDRITATVGGQTYRFEVSMRPFKFSNPQLFPEDVPHHQEIMCKTSEVDE